MNEKTTLDNAQLTTAPHKLPSIASKTIKALSFSLLLACGTTPGEYSNYEDAGFSDTREDSSEDATTEDTSIEDTREDTTEDTSVEDTREDIEITPQCDPIPDCPVAITRLTDENVYTREDRWFRVNPETGDTVVVCNPDRSEDELPPCDDAILCDPLPSRANYESPRIGFEKAPYPDNSLAMFQENPYSSEDLVFDQTPDCIEGETAEDIGDHTLLLCDLIPTCDPAETFSIPCTDIPQCELEQSPISCSDLPASWETRSLSECRNYIRHTKNRMYRLGINVDTLFVDHEYCTIGSDGELTNLPPIINLECLPLRECAPEENPEARERQIAYPLDCGDYAFYPTDRYEVNTTCSLTPFCE